MDGSNHKLKFTNDQYGKLNYLLSKKALKDDDNYDIADQSLTIVERLVQRLICSIGNTDQRFASKFLISLQSGGYTERLSGRKVLEYIVRLDDLSSPSLYRESRKPKCEIYECDTDIGYAKVLVKDQKKWSEFINNGGYLRRDKLQERFVELLALAAASPWPSSPLDVDESLLCGAPGKILDAYTLHEVLKLSPEEQVFYGAAVDVERFPEPRDFRLAIVDEPSGVRLRVGFLSRTLAGTDIEVHLLLGVGLDLWPRTSSFPTRIPLEHPECLLYYQAAQTGMYLVSSGMQTANWQIRLPAAECFLLKHYGPSSSVSIVLDTLTYVLQEIQLQCRDFTSKYIWHHISPYFIHTILWYYMEQEDCPPVQLIQNWSLKSTSKHTLALLELVSASLRSQNQPSYFFQSYNLLPTPGHTLKEDYLQISSQIHVYVSGLYEASLKVVKDTTAFEKMVKFEQVDSALIDKWGDVVGGLLPPAATRSSRFSFAASNSKQEIAHTQYTNRQLEYIGLVLKHMLAVKKVTIQASEFLSTPSSYSEKENPVEDIIFLLVTIMEQVWRSKHREKGPKTTLRSKNKAAFDAATSKLVESLRKSKDLLLLDFRNDLVLVQTVLRWLYKGLDQSKHSLAPVLRPYLQKLFINSHELCWHLNSIKLEEISNEMKALGIFCRLVNLKEVSPASGLVDSINKGWNWAKACLSFVEAQGKVSFLFVPSRGKVVRHTLAMPEKRDDYGTTRKLQEINGTLTKRMNSLWRQDEVSVGNNKNTQHVRLRDSSPLTSVIDQKFRYGNHRCFGDLIHSLVALNKISEISSLLPVSDRQNVLSSIQKLSKDNKKYLTLRRRNSVTVNPVNKKDSMFRPTYTLKLDESSRREERVEKRGEEGEGRKDKWDSKEPLIENCRSARILDDAKVAFADNLKVRQLCQFNQE